MIQEKILATWLLIQKFKNTAIVQYEAIRMEQLDLLV